MHRKRIRKRNQAAMIVIITVVVILMIVLFVQGNYLRDKLNTTEQRISDMKQQIEEETLRTTEISDMEKYMQTDEYLEKMAKEKLGLVEDDEIVFKEE